MPRNKHTKTAHDGLQRSSATDPCRPHKAKDITLPVIADDAARLLAPSAPAGMRPSRMGKWRATSLIIVHVLMIAHVLHWLWTGTTVSPIEPSEAKDFALSGIVNAGFIFFTLAIASTLIFGRYFCGWGCHLVAYQDFTLWLLKKLHLRPREFKSRLLVYVPLIAAIYMFVWPAIYRFVLRIEPPPVSVHLTTTGFWNTFPSYGVAMLTVFICGVATIYFLGPKGFCTYACPYGGFFGPVDKLAVGRIRVTEACNACGHCTATCTSNVDVAQEVKLFKMVVSPGCMKCMDCVSVCPTNALYFGFGAPSIGAKPVASPKPRKYDLTLVEELAAGVIFCVTFLAYRSLYGKIPFLLSLAIAAIVAFFTLKAASLLYRPEASMQKVRLKIGGKIRPAGLAFAFTVALLLAFTAHSAVWRYHDYMGNRAYAMLPGEELGWQHQPDYAARLTADQRRAAVQTIDHLRRAERIGFMRVEENQLALSWAHLMNGETDEARSHLTAILQRRPDDALLWLKLATYEVFAGHKIEARDAYRKALELCEPIEAGNDTNVKPSPNAGLVWADWGLFLAARGDDVAARQALNRATQFDPDSSAIWGALGAYELAAGRVNHARPALIQSVKIAPHNHASASRLEQLARTPQDFPMALKEYDAALGERPSVLVFLYNRAYALTELERFDVALSAYREIVRDWPDTAAAHADLGALLVMRGDLAGATREYEHTVRLLPDDGEASLRLAFLYEQGGRRDDARRLYQRVLQTGGPEHKKIAEAALNR